MLIEAFLIFYLSSALIDKTSTDYTFNQNENKTCKQIQYICMVETNLLTHIQATNLFWIEFVFRKSY